MILVNDTVSVWLTKLQYQIQTFLSN
jgi:hypothetical protein